MKIRKLSIQNFRGLENIDCDFDQPTNVIVGPNAIGKTTILEAIRLTKALLIPRYVQEGQQVLVSLGAMSQHPQLSNYLDYSVLARDVSDNLRVSMTLEIDEIEHAYLLNNKEQIALHLLQGQLARQDEQSQLALTQYLSSDDGKARLAAATEDVESKLTALVAPYNLPITLVIDARNGKIGGSDALNQSLLVILERRCGPHEALFSYFPADRAFPPGETNVQIGSGDASNQIQSHIGQASTKFARLKQTIVNTMLLSGIDENTLGEDFKLVLEKLIPGKELGDLSVTQIGSLKVSIKELSTGKVFDIDSMSSGEKGLILTFLLLRRSVAVGGIALVDEPELHLNPAVCKNIIPFLNDTLMSDHNIQIIICTHSAEILGTAFDRPDCSIHHLRSHKDATKIYERDNREVFDALRRLGTNAAESLFSRGNIFVEGEHDAAILEEGFYDQVMGYKITSLGGRSEVEKEILLLQNAEKKGDLDKLNCFIFDLDRKPVDVKSTDLVRVLQWDRYCLENYLLERKTLFDELTESGVKDLGSRGTFEKTIVKLAMEQLTEDVARTVYTDIEPDNAGLRSKEIRRKSYAEISSVLGKRLGDIKENLQDFDEGKWSADFVNKCEADHKKSIKEWEDDWIKKCSGKRLIDDIYSDFTVRISKFDLKRRLAKRIRIDESEDWTLVKSKMRDALGV